MIFFHKYWFKFVCKEGRRSTLFASFLLVLHENTKFLPKIDMQMLIKVNKIA